MQRILLFIIVFLLLNSGPLSAQETLGKVVSVQSILLEKPEIFQLKGGDERGSRNVSVITVELNSILRFLPRALNPPSVIVGDTLAKPLFDPAITGQLVVIAPVPDGQPVNLSLVDDALVPCKNSDGKSSMRLREDFTAQTVERIEVPVSRSPQVEVPDLEQLRTLYVKTKGRLQP